MDSEVARKCKNSNRERIPKREEFTKGFTDCRCSIPSVLSNKHSGLNSCETSRVLKLLEPYQWKPSREAEVGEGDVLVEARVDRPKGAEVLPSKVRIKIRERPPIWITHL